MSEVVVTSLLGLATLVISLLFNGVIVVVLKFYLDGQMERQRLRLGAEAFEHETRFAKLHEKRADVVERTYSLLVRTHRDFQAMTSPREFAGGPAKEEMMKIAVKSANSFQEYFQEHRIFLEADLCTRLDSFNNKLSEAYGALLRSQDPKRAALDRAQGEDRWLKARKVVQEEMPELLQAIERSFRELLGVA